MAKEKKKVKSCIVKGCTNTSDQGAFVGDLCFPCHDFIATGKGKYSAVFRLAVRYVIIQIFLAMEDAIVNRLK